MAYVHPRNTRSRKGRCKPCGVTYTWTGGPRLAETACGRCGRELGYGTSRRLGKLLLEQPPLKAAMSEARS